MKNKGQLIAMVGILLFAIVMFIQPWKYFQSDNKKPAVQQAAQQQTTEVTTQNPDAPAAPDTAEAQASSETVSADAPAEEEPSPTLEHDPANLYDIDKDDFMD